ncbi:MAG: hypothetical protein AAB390_05070 [Patescibacteria group bacterium]
MPGIQKAYTDKLRLAILEYAEKRREVIKASGDALHHAKRSIFSLHRGNRAEAEQKLAEVEAIYKNLNGKFKNEPSIFAEGSYLAGLEEYVEAKLFYNFVIGGKIGEIKEMRINGETYIAGLCDLPGELHRYAIRAATEKNMEMVKKCATMANEIIGVLIEFNLTSYLRTKFDQAKQAAQKLEVVVYEVSLRE